MEESSFPSNHFSYGCLKIQVPLLPVLSKFFVERQVTAANISGLLVNTLAAVPKSALCNPRLAVLLNIVVQSTSDGERKQKHCRDGSDTLTGILFYIVCFVLL